MGKPAAYISPVRSDRLLRQLPDKHRLIVEVAAATGLRISDVLQLQTEDVAQLRTRRCWLRVYETKTGKTRTVRLPAQLVRRLAAQCGQYWCFESPRDPRKHLSRQAVNKMLAGRAAALKLGQRVSPHSFRKQYAVRLMHDTRSLEKVRRVLGHERRETTALYALSDVLADEEDEPPPLGGGFCLACQRLPFGRLDCGLSHFHPGVKDALRPKGVYP